LDDHDAAWWEANGGSHWWDPTKATYPNFTRYLAWVSDLRAKTSRQQVAWQVPVGNQYFLTMNNTCGHYQDNVTQYFLAHPNDLVSAGIIAVLLGAGNACQTAYTDQQNDGITNGNGQPTTDLAGFCNACNTHASTVSDDDGGFIRTFVGQYYANSSVPGSPTGVFALAGEASATVTWAAPSVGLITSYTVTAAPGGATVTAPGTAQSATVTGLTDGSTYTFTVTAANSAGASPPSAVSNPVIPDRRPVHPLAPARILDTRTTSALGPAETRNVPIAGQQPVPASGVSAVVLNVTVTDTTASSCVSLSPAAPPQPPASNLNWTVAET